MTHKLTSNYAKNYCNRTLIVKVIVENVVTCLFLGHGVQLKKANNAKYQKTTLVQSPLITLGQ